MATIDDALFSYRRLNLLGFALSGCGLAYASISLAPVLEGIDCGLCAIARASLLGLSVMFVIAFLLNPWVTGQRILAFIALLIAAAGMAASVRYHWLSASFAPNECSLGLDALQSTPLFQTHIAPYLPTGTECIPPSWQFYGLNLADVAMLLFFLLILIASRLLLRRPPARRTYF